MRTPPYKIVWRFATGAALDGKYRTDASWLHKSTVTLWPHRVVRWHHLPRLYRAAVRNGTVAVVVVSLTGAATHPLVTAAAWGAGLLAAAGWAGWRLWRKVRYFRHHWRYVRPLRRKLTRQFQGAPPRLEIAPKRDRVTVWLPPELTFTPRDWELLELAVTSTTGLQSPDLHRALEGPKPFAIYDRTVPPPARVTSKDILSAIESAAEHEVILGTGIKDQVINVSLDSEAPHVGACMTTGDGKSTAAMNVSAQVLWHGGLVVILDPKLMSHMWARGLPNVAYAGTAPELHQMLCWLAGDEEGESELTRRKRVALASADIRGNVAADLGPRMLILAEELNVMQKILKKYWRQIGGKGPSPASEALEEIHFTGRQLRMHAFDIGQRLSAKATSGGGSADSRENIGAIIFSNPSASTWKMLCDGHVQPPATDHKGRYQLFTRNEVRVFQGALWDEEDARAFATAGTVASPRHDMPLVTRTLVPVGVGHPPIENYEGPDQGFVVGQAPDVPGLPGAVTLREAAAAGIFPTKAAAHKAALRAGLVSVGERGAAKLYLITDLAACQQRKAANR
jgi:hypothetical protein